MCWLNICVNGTLDFSFPLPGSDDMVKTLSAAALAVTDNLRAARNSEHGSMPPSLCPKGDVLIAYPPPLGQRRQARPHAILIAVRHTIRQMGAAASLCGCMLPKHLCRVFIQPPRQHRPVKKKEKDCVLSKASSLLIGLKWGGKRALR